MGRVFLPLQFSSLTGPTGQRAPRQTRPEEARDPARSLNTGSSSAGPAGPREPERQGKVLSANETGEIHLAAAGSSTLRNYLFLFLRNDLVLRDSMCYASVIKKLLLLNKRNNI